MPSPYGVDTHILKLFPHFEAKNMDAEQMMAEFWPSFLLNNSMCVPVATQT